MTAPCYVAFVCGRSDALSMQDNTIRQLTSNMCLELANDKLTMKPCVGTDHQIWHWRRRTPDSVLQNTSSVARV